MIIRPAATAVEVDQAYEVAAHVFGSDYLSASAVKRHLRALDPVEDLRDVIVAAAGPEIVGLVRIVNRRLWIGAGLVQAGGVTSVALRPDQRGRGYGRALIDAAVERSVERGDALSIAFGRRAVDGFYWRLGYLGIGSHPELVVERAASGDVAPASAPAGFRRELAAVYAEAYRASYAPLFLSFARDADWWRHGTERIAGRDPSWAFHTITKGEQPAGYFVAKDRAIIEAAAIAGQEAAVLWAIAEAARAAPVVLRLPRTHWAMARSRRLNHTEQCRFSWDGGHVARIIDLAALCQALEPYAPLAGAAAQLRGRCVRAHAEAREALSTLAGLTQDDALRLQHMPAWSPIDEF